MLKDKDNQLSIYSILYNNIPKNHTLKLINEAIDLTFVTVSKKHKTDKKGRQTYQYLFKKEQCRNCPNRSECKPGTRIARLLEVGINTPEFYVYNQEQKTEGFQEKYKSRAAHEGKNGEMKNHHGLDRARGYGKRSMSTQAKLTAIAVNLKRIAGILSSKIALFLNVFIFNIKIYENSVI